MNSFCLSHTKKTTYKRWLQNEKTEQDKQNKTSDQLQQVQPEEGTDTTMEQISDTYKEGTIEDTDR